MYSEIGVGRENWITQLSPVRSMLNYNRTYYELQIDVLTDRYRAVTPLVNTDGLPSPLTGSMYIILRRSIYGTILNQV